MWNAVIHCQIESYQVISKSLKVYLVRLSGRDKLWDDPVDNIGGREEVEQNFWQNLADEACGRKCKFFFYIQFQYKINNIAVIKY